MKVLALVLQCWLVQAALAQNNQYTSTDSLTSVGTLNFKGSTLRIFEFDGAQVAEPRVGFGETCDAVRFVHMYQKYQLTLPILIDANALETPTDSSKRVGQVVLTDLLTRADKGLLDSKLTVLAKLTKPGQAELNFLCDTFVRCQELRDEFSTNPELLQGAVKFVPVGRIGNTVVKFGAGVSTSLPRFSCPVEQWVVLQKRVDGSLSFAQNWNAYVRGFGNPETNYWIGLDKLFAMTATAAQNPFADTSRCQLRIETEDFAGKTYWGEYKFFQVLGPDQNYRLRVGQEVSGSQMAGFISIHNGMQFSTFDQDHDTYSASCSQQFGFGGWWYAACHHVNLNGAYTTEKAMVDSPNYDCVYIPAVGKFLPMKRTLMKFKCF